MFFYLLRIFTNAWKPIVLFIWADAFCLDKRWRKATLCFPRKNTTAICCKISGQTAWRNVRHSRINQRLFYNLSRSLRQNKATFSTQRVKNQIDRQDSCYASWLLFHYWKLNLIFISLEWSTDFWSVVTESVIDGLPSAEFTKLIFKFDI